MKNKKREIIPIREMNFDEFNYLIKQVHEFIDGFEDARCADDSIEIKIMSNGDIIISAEFSTREQKTFSA